MERKIWWEDYQSIKKTFFLTGLTIGFFATLCGIILGVLLSINIEKIRIFLSSVFNLEIFPQDIYFLERLPSEINFYSVLIVFFIVEFSGFFSIKLPQGYTLLLKNVKLSV